MPATRLRSLVVFGSLLLACMALSHQLVDTLVPGRSVSAVPMIDPGHDGYRLGSVVVVVVVGFGLVAIALRQLRRLSRLASATAVGSGGLGPRAGELSALLRSALPLWLRLALSTALAFVVQENLELATVGGAMPGLEVVSGAHAGALPILAAVSLAVAGVRALVTWRRNVLLARIRAARRVYGARVLRPRSGVVDAASNEGSRRKAVRAPPSGVTAFA